MRLEARPEACFSSTFVLKLDGQPIGKYEGRFLGSGLDVALLGRRRLELTNLNWLSSHFVLREGEGEPPVAEAEPHGAFTSSWGLRLSAAPATMERAGWFSSAYVVRRGDWHLARVDRLGACERGWAVECTGPLTRDDLLMIGLLYHVLLQRQAAAGAAAGAGS
jgi:hypothetical protein